MCTKENCENEVFPHAEHPPGEAYCMRHLLMVLRDRQRMRCACGQAIFLMGRDKCSRCSDPWMATSHASIDNARRIMQSWRCEEKSIPEGVPHDC